MAGAALVLAGFFADWFGGTAEFAARDFSGFDLARLIRNFQIASSPDEAGQWRAAAGVLYLAPALAINAGVMSCLPVQRVIASASALLAGAYAALVLGALGVLSAVSWTDLGGVMGALEVGYFITGTGAAALMVTAVLQFRSTPGREVRD